MTSLKLLTSKQIGREFSALFIALIALFLFISLVSYSPRDNTWLNASLGQHYANWGGYIGASVADTLFMLFGFVAYLVPVIIIFWCILGFIHIRAQRKVNYIQLTGRVIGVFFFFLSCCALVQQSILHSGYFDSGGVIGVYIQTQLTPLFGFVGRTLLLIAIWLLSLTLTLHVSWLYFCERLGYGCYFIVKNIRQLLRRSKKKNH